MSHLLQYYSIMKNQSSGSRGNVINMGTSQIYEQNR